ncbi:hypothetical protein CSC3H3_04685 [Thalassospira marina]|uniref:Uncharacterized protein n=1 Tax=Thalassospira marina TaxID=2048283 RepID=A0ABM6Q6E1_9PROT|nr:hypothetical protein CSC3H3_04685 [Thalassospira marina]
MIATAGFEGLVDRDIWYKSVKVNLYFGLGYLFDGLCFWLGNFRPLQAKLSTLGFVGLINFLF